MLRTKFLKSIFCFFICFLTIENAFSQIDADSLKTIIDDITVTDAVRFKAINTYYRTNTYAKPDKTLTLAEYHIDLAKKNGSKREIAKALNEKSFAYYLKGDTKKSMVTTKQTAAIYEEIGDLNALATIYGNIGNIYGEERKYQEAVRYFNKTLAIFQKEGIEKGEARMLNNLGIVYYQLDSYDLALTNFNKALDIYNKLNLQDQTGAIVSQIGFINLKKGAFNKAINNGEIALEILLKTNDQFDAADCYFLLASAHKELNNLEKAAYYVDKSLAIDREIKNNSRIIERLTFKAELSYFKDIKLATKKAEAILELIEDDTENRLKVDVYQLLYKCYKNQNQNKISLEMLEKHLLYKDSLAIEKKDLNIIETAIKKEFENKLLINKIANEKIQADLKLKQLKRSLLITAIAILLIIFIHTYYRGIIKKNRKKREQLLLEIEQLKTTGNNAKVIPSNTFQLNIEKIEHSIGRKINETDKKVLHILLEDPVISNKGIAEKAFLSVDGIGSSLRRMYDYFEIKESKYKKISLLMDAIRRSNEIVS